MASSQFVFPGYFNSKKQNTQHTFIKILAEGFEGQVALYTGGYVVKQVKHRSEFFENEVRINSLIYGDSDIISNKKTNACFYMPYIEGERLFSMRENKDKDRLSILKMYKSAMLALQHLHYNNIVHKDLHIDNILVTDGSVNFCDFGSALIVDRTSMTEDEIQYLFQEEISKLASILKYHFKKNGKKEDKSDVISKILESLIPENPDELRDLNPKIYLAKAIQAINVEIAFGQHYVLSQEKEKSFDLDNTESESKIDVSDLDEGTKLLKKWPSTSPSKTKFGLFEKKPIENLLTVQFDILRNISIFCADHLMPLGFIYLPIGKNSLVPGASWDNLSMNATCEVQSSSKKL